MMNEDQLNAAIQRWQSTPDGDLEPEDHQQFKRLGSACLAEGASAQLRQFLEDEKNQGFAQSMGCSLLEPLLNEVVKREKSSDHCQAAITQLTRICSPKELVHNFLEIIEDTGPGVISETILTVIPHLQTALLRLRLRDGQAAGVGAALSALHKQLSRLPVPYSSRQEEEDAHGLCRCCGAMAAFTKPFTEVMVVTGDPEHEELKTELRNFCMRSLRDPLLDAELNRNRKSSLWHFASEIMLTLRALHQSLPELLFFSPLRRRTESDGTRRSKESTACLAYLLFVQLISVDSFPAVFSPVFVLQCNMDHISLLLNSKKESHVRKGMALFERSLESLPDSSLPVTLLELNSLYHVSQGLRRILTDCPLQRLRESGLQVFQLLINKFNDEAKHKFFRCMLRTSSHAGLEGYIIKNIRNQVEFAIQSGSASGWFLGEGLVTLLGLALCLPQGANTDLLGGMDRVMESLNLLRCLVLRENILRDAGGVWGEVCRLKDKYLTVVRVCIGFSRNYYRAEVKSLREGQKQKATEAKEAARAKRLVESIKVKEGKASGVSPELQHQVLQCALVTFDLMESLIVRIEEITVETHRTPQLNRSSDFPDD